MISRFRGTRRFLAAHGPTFFGRVGLGLLGAAFLLFAALLSEEWALIPIALGVLLLVIYFMGGWLWGIYLRHDAADDSPDQLIIRLGSISAGDMITVIDLGQRHLALDLSRYMSTGRVTVADIFNPQIFDRSVINRWRAVMPKTPDDPRLVWRVGSFNLLPIQDSSQDAVVLCEVLSELVQEGDQKILLEEVYRILRPGGRIILVEPLRSLINRLLLGWGARRYRPLKTWVKLLEQTDYLRLKPVKINDVVVYLRGEKLEPMQGIQLSLIRD
ncbi:MAG: class I SAM-dependent methyltransferase [Ardenticatenaceae bacterium]|nr:class I SAM-dependent methyltransferase [Ardenticatenaceae bacterium]